MCRSVAENCPERESVSTHRTYFLCIAAHYRVGQSPLKAIPLKARQALYFAKIVQMPQLDCSDLSAWPPHTQIPNHSRKAHD